MDPRIALLKKLEAADPPVLRPESDIHSPCGYTYPLAREVLGGDPGDDVIQLEPLADMGLLERQFHDKVHLCPSCSFFTLNFREVCPRCASANVDITEMVHHYKCGYVGPETEFRDGVRYECPKCSRPLRHIGLDYERPSATYVCHSCKEIIAEPKVNCLCLRCGTATGVEKAVVRTIHAYRLTSKGALAAARGTMEEATAVGAFVDPELGIYTYSFFEERLTQEATRSKRYARPLCVLFMKPDGLQGYLEAHGQVARAKLLKEMARVVRESLRGSDLSALHQEETFVLLLTDTRLDQSYYVVNRLRKRAEEISGGNGNGHLTISIGLAAFSDDCATGRSMIDAANERLAEARAAGGDCVRPPAP